MGEVQVNIAFLLSFVAGAAIGCIKFALRNALVGRCKAV
jgi:hypothetical protein